MATKIYENGTVDVTVPSGEKIAVFSNGAYNVYQQVGYPNHPSEWDLLNAGAAGSTYTSAAFSAATLVRVEMSADFGFYEVGAAPVVSDPQTDINAADATFTVQGLAAAQGGYVRMVGGVSSTAGNAGGAAELYGGTPGATGVGGAINLVAAAGGATSGTGGAINGTAGAGTNGNAVGGAVVLTAGAGQGTGTGGAATFTAGASGAGATGTGGAAAIAGGASAATAGAGGAASVTGGAGAGTGNGGAASIIGGAAGATGTGGAVIATGGAATAGAGGAATITAGAGGGTGAGGAASLTAGASGAGATGNGGTASLVGGAAASTNGNGGNVILTPGALAGTGVAGMVVANGVLVVDQGAPNAQTVAATLTIANLLTGIITGTHAAGATQAYTLPTGTLTDAGVQMAANEAFEWVLINLSAAAVDTITVTAGVGHTLVGGGIVQSGNSARFRTRKTAANTFVTYRI